MVRTVPPLVAIAVAATLLVSCNSSPEAEAPPERIAFDDVQRVAGDPAPSPDTSDAVWTVTEDGQAINFGAPGAAPFLSLSCLLRDDPPQLAIIRHVAARPGQQALFPVIGNGTISRFPLDATLEDGEWRWQGGLPAADARLDVFTGAREIQATLPGGGMLVMEGSRVPGEFVRWCRAGGRLKDALVEEAENTAGQEADATAGD